ncbi:uncharacterized protein LOC144107699 [Amblyomma americanum]
MLCFRAVAVRENYHPDHASLAGPGDSRFGQYLGASAVNVEYGDPVDGAGGGEWPQCQLCGDVFAHLQDLLEHRASVHGEQPFGCNLCPAKFASKMLLNKHVRRHAGERPHPCHVCQRRFTQRTHLVEHMRLHTGERPFRCHECQATFVQKTHLVGHMRTHTGEKPFRCPDCPKAYASRSGLIKHRFVTHFVRGEEQAGQGEEGRPPVPGPGDGLRDP